MAESLIQDDVIGRVHNTRLHKSQSLIAVFEAVVNSLHAIQDCGAAGRVHIEILRSTQTSIDGATLPPVSGFEVTDNGAGFNDTNYASFCTADSRLKIGRGGKGIGRFIWLKAFQQVGITSSYEHNGQMMFRSFDFLAQHPPIQNLQTVLSPGDRSTKVKLHGIRQAYEGSFPASADVLAERLIRHLLVFLIQPDCAEIQVSDPIAEKYIDVKKHFREHLLVSSTDDEFELKNERFRLAFIYMHAGSEVNHKLVLCADGREVITYPLHNLLVDIKGRPVPSSDGSPCELWAVVSGDYLDRAVSQERTGFMFADSEAADSDAFDVTQRTCLKFCVRGIS